MSPTKKQKEQNPARHKIIKKLIGLAMLPNKEILNGFRLVDEERVEKFENDIRLHQINLKKSKNNLKLKVRLEFVSNSFQMHF